ncbi:MAG: non-canonical purine NTP pyrophosphatase [Candidatus Pelagibacter sp.]|nr:non-canonical purine NTP pyrophosphatase [Candidatus Pelagibacter sp.]|tara:strand:+ start:576 stop:1178 length:603 start_codon:yes stop_codon:yes gene_type:complete
MEKKKIKEIIIGSNNQGKLREIGNLLPKSYVITSPNEYGFKSPVENGKNFLENSLIKARFFSKKSNKICIADDSGLEIDILNKKPGIFSARWGGKKNDFDLAISKVYKELFKVDKNWYVKKIIARFICALTIYGLKEKPIQSLGIIEGTISKKKIGTKGFGYDPIFIPKGKKITFGQMKPALKNKIDHRAKAFRKIKKFL